MTKAVDKVRRPRASAGESAPRAGAEVSAAATGSGIDPGAADLLELWLVDSEAGPGLGMAAF